MASIRKPIPDGYQHVPPDGGWGWVVVAGTALIGMVISLPLVAIGLMFSDIIYQLNTSATTASWIPAITVSTAMFVAPFNTMIINRWSSRTSLFVGGTLCSVGMILSYFATRIEFLFFSFGILSGAGLGVSSNTSYVVLSQYFTVKKHYGIATGIMMATAAVGKLIFSPLIQLMLESYGFRGVFFILGGLEMNIFVGAALCQPAKWHFILEPISQDKPTGSKDLKTSYTNNNNDDQTPSNLATNKKEIEMKEISRNGVGLNHKDEEANVSLLSNGHQTALQESEKMSALQLGASWDAIVMEPVVLPDVSPSKQTLEEQRANGCTGCLRSGPLKALQLSLLKERVFYVLLASGFLGFISAVYSAVYMPPLALEKGLEPMQAATMTSARSCTEIVGRLLSPYILHRIQRLGLVPFYVGLNVAQGIALLALVFTYTYVSMTVLGAILGLFNGGATGLSIVVIVDCVGASRLSAILGLTQFIQGFFVIGVGPFLGFLKDLTGSYDYSFIFMTVTQFLLCAVWTINSLCFKKV